MLEKMLAFSCWAAAIGIKKHVEKEEDQASMGLLYDYIVRQTAFDAPDEQQANEGSELRLRAELSEAEARNEANAERQVLHRTDETGRAER